MRSRDAKRDLNPRKFSFSFSNFEGFRERGQRLESRIGEGNPRNFSKFEGENEGNKFENSREFSKIGLSAILAKQGCRNVLNIGGAPIHLDQSFIESMQLLVPKITDVGTFPLYLWH